jgi:hypothetical protein
MLEKPPIGVAKDAAEGTGDALGGHALGALKSLFSIGIKVYNLTIPNVQVQANCGANECYTAFFNR